MFLQLRQLLMGIVFLFIGFKIDAQIIYNGMNYIPLENNNVNKAISLCKANHYNLHGTFSSTEGFICNNGFVKLYYTLFPKVNFQLNNGGSILEAIAMDLSTPLATSYKLFGPFEGDENVSPYIENGTISPIEIGNFSTLPHTMNSNVLANKKYVIEVTVQACQGLISFHSARSELQLCTPSVSCEDCLPKFQPANGKYIVSAWVKEDNSNSASLTSYTNSSLKVTSGGNVSTFQPKGQIIDGWQRIEGVIQTDNIGSIKMELLVSSGVSYFDDLRIFPFDGSMVSYVYDASTFRLMAELDDRNYATLYEYDEEGKLIRVKKETEKGVMTIQEGRENSSLR